MAGVSLERFALQDSWLYRDFQDVATSSDPFLLAVGVVGILAVLVGGWLLYRWFRRPHGVRFRRILSGLDDATILMHPNPDPDAMACAMGVDALADLVDTKTTIQFSGEIRHQENRAFRTVLDLDLDSVETKSDLASENVILVDHNTPRGFTGSQNVEPVAVIDHHPGNGTGTMFTDVRTEYGAASSIIVEYLQANGAILHSDESDGSIVIPSTLATGLMYGIQSDTDHLTKGCTRADFDACEFLYQAVDSDLLDRIANPQVSDDVLQIKAEAITNKRVEGSFAVCDVGEVSNVDAIPQAADELLHLEGVTAVVVFGENDGMLHLSGRSRDDRVHMGETLQAVVNEIPMSNAGGHARMGGGQISVDHMNGIGPSGGMNREELQERLFGAMAGERTTV